MTLTFHRGLYHDVCIGLGQQPDLIFAPNAGKACEAIRRVLCTRPSVWP